MSASSEAELLAASQCLRVPGTGEQRVLSPTAVERLADAWVWPRWKVEALAADLEIIPLRYLRNLSQFGLAGQARLLKATVALVGREPALERAVELLAGSGVGSFRVLATAAAEDDDDAATWFGRRLEAIAHNRNAGCSVEIRALRLREGNPREALEGVDAAAACLADSMDEQLLQFACRVARSPLVLAGTESRRAQATTVFPGDPGVALVYKPSHPHLEPRRVSPADRLAALMAGTWIADLTTQALLDPDTVPRSLLRYADMETGENDEYSLGA